MTEAATGASLPVEVGFRVATSVSDAASTVSVTGSIDMMTAPPFARAVAAAQDDVPRGVIIDLSGVDFLGSAGLSVLVDAARRATETGSGLVIAAANHPVVHALEVTGLDTVLTVTATQEEALARLAGGSAED